MKISEGPPVWWSHASAAGKAGDVSAGSADLDRQRRKKSEFGAGADISVGADEATALSESLWGQRSRCQACTRVCVCVSVCLNTWPAWLGRAQQQTDEGKGILWALNSPGSASWDPAQHFLREGLCPIPWLCSWGRSLSSAGWMLSSSTAVSAEESSALGCCVVSGNSLRKVWIWSLQQYQGHRESCSSIRRWSLPCFQHEAHTPPPSFPQNAGKSWAPNLSKPVARIYHEKCSMRPFEKEGEGCAGQARWGRAVLGGRGELVGAGLRQGGEEALLARAAHSRGVTCGFSHSQTPGEPPDTSLSLQSGGVGLLRFLLHWRVSVTPTWGSWDSAGGKSSHLPQAEFKDSCTSLAWA